MRLRFLSAAVLLAAWWTTASAAEVVNAGLVLKREDGMRIASQSFLLSPERVETEMVATNVGREPVTMMVTLPVPAMEFPGGESPAIRDVKLAADGRAVNVRRQLVVLLGGKDISWRIALHRWSEQEFLDFMRGAPAPAGKMALPAGWFDRSGKPRFSMHRQYVWDQRFPSGTPVKLTASYLPVLMSTNSPSATALVASLGKEGCTDANITSRLQGLGASAGISLATLAFEPMGGMAWKRPVPEVSLRVRKPAETDVVWSCLDGGKKVDARVFEYRRKEFALPRRINLRFASAVAR